MTSFDEKEWKGRPDRSTPVNAAALNDLEARIGDAVTELDEAIDGSGAVASVNGQTGTVVLGAADVGAASAAELADETEARGAADSALDTRVDAIEAGGDVDLLVRRDPDAGVDTTFIDGRTGLPRLAGSSLPDGGTDGQVLTKLSSTDGDADWETPSGGAPSVEIVRLAQSPDVVPGRTIYADFADATQIAGIFDLIGPNVPTLTTDPGDSNRPALTVVSNNQAGFILAKPEHQFRNAEVFMRYRVTAGPHIVSSFRSVHRYASATQFTFAGRGFAGQSGGGFNYTGNGQSAAAVGSGLFNADAGAIIYQKSRIIDDLYMYKVWPQGTTEPDWTAVDVAAGGNFVQEIGRCGARLNALDATVYLTELIITELLPASDNMIFNSDLSLTKIPGGTGPLNWTTGGALPGNLNEVVSIPDASGVTRRFIHIGKTAEGDAGSTVNFQIRKRANAYDGRVRGGQGRTSPWFDAKAVEIGVTSKATNVRHATPGGDFMGAGVILYYGRATTTNPANDVAGMVAPYYAVLGPNRLASAGQLASNGLDGCGTWDWRRDKLRIKLEPDTTYINFFIGLHDADVLGDLWFGDVTMRPVA